jgi:hypothetical protein
MGFPMGFPSSTNWRLRNIDVNRTSHWLQRWLQIGYKDGYKLATNWLQRWLQIGYKDGCKIKKG